jgi:hypothetical protein
VIILRRRNARVVVAYRWDPRTGLARLRREGVGGPATTEEVSQPRWFLSPDQKAGLDRRSVG